MKRQIVYYFLWIFAVVAIKANEFKNIDAQTFSNLIESGEGVIVDVRTSGEYSRGHIEGATLICINDKAAAQKVNLLQKDKPVYVYCLSGSRSRSVASYLSKNGFTKVYNLQRGIMEWQRSGFPLIKSAAPETSNGKTFSQSEFNAMLATSSLVLVDFQAAWCAPCQKMNPIVDEIQEKYKEKLHVQKLDVEVNGALQSVYNIQSIPGLILFKNGQKVWQHTGSMSYAELTKIIEEYMQ